MAQVRQVRRFVPILGADRFLLRFFFHLCRLRFWRALSGVDGYAGIVRFSSGPHDAFGRGHFPQPGEKQMVALGELGSTVALLPVTYLLAVLLGWLNGMPLRGWK